MYYLLLYFSPVRTLLLLLLLFLMMMSRMLINIYIYNGLFYFYSRSKKCSIEKTCYICNFFQFFARKKNLNSIMFFSYPPFNPLLGMCPYIFLWKFVRQMCRYIFTIRKDHLYMFPISRLILKVQLLLFYLFSLPSHFYFS